MGDTFYERQGQGRGKAKPKKRILKKDLVKEISLLLEADIPGLDKCTMDTLRELSLAVANAHLEKKDE